jgi:innexin
MNNVFKIFKNKYSNPIERLNYYITPTILLIFAVFLSAKQYFGKPIQCLIPTEFKNGWDDYVEDYCFVQNTYIIANKELFSIDTALFGDFSNEKKEINYYQWVPLMLILQALMFYVPNIIWKICKHFFNLEFIIKDVSKTNLIPERLQKISANLKQNFIYSKCLPIDCSITIAYAFVKLLSLLNLLLQFALLMLFIGQNYIFWGLSAIKMILFGNGWVDSPMFPRVTLCDFNVYRLAADHHYTVQCVLMINMFNEKIYLFLWYWFFLLLTGSLIDILFCIYNSIMAPLLWKKRLQKIYGESYLTLDGLFILKMIEQEMNGGEKTIKLIREI